MPNNEKLDRFRTAAGFIAALDQSGGSSPKALAQYGIEPSEYSSDAEMFDLIHAERTRIVTSPAFTGDRVLAAIMFEDTMDREVDGRPTADYLWSVKGVIPFLKIDKGLQDEADGVQLMKDIPGLDETLAKAAAQGVIGTKERSVIHSADPAGIYRIVDQQFAVAQQVIAAGLLPILEPEIDIHAPDKQRAEELLKAAILEWLPRIGDDLVAIKISLPSVDGFYNDLMRHPNVARVVALSGGYTRDEADEHLRRNPGLVASFSRALLEGLNVHQSDEEFNTTLDSSIEQIYQASTAR